MGTLLELEEAVDMGHFLFLMSALLGVHFLKTVKESESCANKTMVRSNKFDHLNECISSSINKSF